MDNERQTLMTDFFSTRKKCVISKNTGENHVVGCAELSLTNPAPSRKGFIGRVILESTKFCPCDKLYLRFKFIMHEL